MSSLAANLDNNSAAVASLDPRHVKLEKTICSGIKFGMNKDIYQKEDRYLYDLESWLDGRKIPDVTTTWAINGPRATGKEPAVDPRIVELVREVHEIYDRMIAPLAERASQLHKEITRESGFGNKIEYADQVLCYLPDCRITSIESKTYYNSATIKVVFKPIHFPAISKLLGLSEDDIKLACDDSKLGQHLYICNNPNCQMLNRDYSKTGLDTGNKCRFWYDPNKPKDHQDQQCDRCYCDSKPVRATDSYIACREEQAALNEALAPLFNLGFNASVRITKVHKSGIAAKVYISGTNY